MAVPPAMLTSFGLVGAVAFTGTVMAIRRGGGIGWTLGILAALIALTCLGFVGFALWGRHLGMPWSFFPATGQ